MAESLFEQAKTHIDRGEADAALVKLTDHMNDHFWDADALFMLGGCLLAKGKYGLGAAMTKLALSIKPKFPEAMMNLGTALRSAHKVKEAEEIYRLGLEIETIPIERAKLLASIAGCYINNGTPEKAIDLLTQALKEAPDFASAQFNRGLAYLENGEWEKGWQGYNGGFASGDRVNRTPLYKNLPEWDGFPGKKVIVWGEQGVGDEIMFASVIPDLVKMSKKVIFDCHPRLVDTFKRSFPDVEIHGTRKTLSKIDWIEAVDADCSICITSLSGFFRNKQSDFPGTPFLKADPAKVKTWTNLGNGKPRIGLAWVGGTHQTRRDLRSIPLMDWLPILQSIDADFYSLQYTPDAAREVCELGERTGIIVRHYPGAVEAQNYDETVNFVASMDLVISVCTAITHVAGGLGKPTWVLTPSKPAWRYGKAGMPWYGSAKLIRQEGGDWTPVIQSVASALKLMTEWRDAA